MFLKCLEVLGKVLGKAKNVFKCLEVLERVFCHYGEPGSIAQLFQVSIQGDAPEHGLTQNCIEIGCGFAKSDKPDFGRPR